MRDPSSLARRRRWIIIFPTPADGRTSPGAEQVTRRVSPSKQTHNCTLSILRSVALLFPRKYERWDGIRHYPPPPHTQHSTAACPNAIRLEDNGRRNGVQCETDTSRKNYTLVILVLTAFSRQTVSFLLVVSRGPTENVLIPRTSIRFDKVTILL